jgi:glycosyltransferase involved in cell wall biosynthesis
MNELLGLVPFGLPETPPVAPTPVLKGVVPGIRENDFVLMWGGGVWNWFDPLTVIRAVAEIGKTRDDVKLYFLGMKHPNPEIPEMAMATQAVALATELGVKDTLVFFNHDWVDYDARQAYLAESDAGVSAHFDSLETRFSFRTRVLDYFWAGLPVLTTEGDGMAEYVGRDGLGEVIAYQDVDGWRQAILKLVEDRDRTRSVSERVTAFSERFRWSRVVEPLAAYCRAPYHTPRSLKPQPDAVQVVAAAPPVPSSGLFQKGLRVLQQEGATVLVKKGLGYVRKRAGRPS